MALTAGLGSLAWEILSDVISPASGCLQGTGLQDPSLWTGKYQPLPGERGSKITTRWLGTGAAPDSATGGQIGAWEAFSHPHLQPDCPLRPGLSWPLDLWTMQEEHRGPSREAGLPADLKVEFRAGFPLKNVGVGGPSVPRLMRHATHLTSACASHEAGGS